MVEISDQAEDLRLIRIRRFGEGRFEYPMYAEFSVSDRDRWVLRMFPHASMLHRPGKRKTQLEVISEFIQYNLGGRIPKSQVSHSLPSHAIPLEVELWDRQAVFYLERKGVWVFEVNPPDPMAGRIETLTEALLDRFGGELSWREANPTLENPIIIRGLFSRVFEDDPLRALNFFAERTNPVYLYYGSNGDWMIRFEVKEEYRTPRYREETRGTDFRRLLGNYFQATPADERETGSMLEPIRQSRAVFRLFNKTAYGYVDENGDWMIQIPVESGPTDIRDLVSLYGGQIVAGSTP